MWSAGALSHVAPFRRSELSMEDPLWTWTSRESNGAL